MSGQEWLVALRGERELTLVVSSRANRTVGVDEEGGGVLATGVLYFVEI